MGAEFAEALRELKERSGLSYGVLAKRLHMSTSTLHRYCNGDAVPVDYAPVERLARLCRATAEELVELHRTWVLADATRRRKGSDSAGAAGGAVSTKAESASGAAAAEPNSDAGAEAEAGPEAGTGTGEAATAGAGAGRGGASDGSGGAADDGPDSAPDGPGGAADGPGGAADGPYGASDGSGGVAVRRSGEGAVGETVIGRDVSGGAGNRSRTERRSRTTLVAGLAVAAVLGAVTLAAGLPSAGEEDGSARWAGDVSVGEEEFPGEERDDRGSPVPSTASPSVSASESGAGRQKGAGQESGPPAGTDPTRTSAAGGGGENASLPAPLSVKVEPYTWESPCSQRYLADRAPAEVGPPPLEQDAAAWASSEGAVSSGQQFLTLTVQGSGEETVVVRSLTVRMVDKRSPLAWNDYAMGYPGVGCGAGVPTRSFTIALDAARPDVKPKAGSRNFPYSVSESDPEVYYITADASAYSVSWYLELKWSSGSRSGTLTLNDDGAPFRTSGNNGRPAYEYPLGGPKWVKEGTTLGAGTEG
ncbi:helix-turn-helix transcriptional regulator [Streptomyces stelliscabiei]|uniref:helix-turn-helix domain-containing protein n=2 Tax=Streptomyces stelliscabiei TaxID=146820 RepID=UPI002FF14B3A